MVMNVEAVKDWIGQFIDDHSDQEDNTDVVMAPQELRIAAVAIAQFARDSRVVTVDQYNNDLFPSVERLLSSG